MRDVDQIALEAARAIDADIEGKSVVSRTQTRALMQTHIATAIKRALRELLHDLTADVRELEQRFK